MKSHIHSNDTIADIVGERAKHYVDAGVDTYNAASKSTRVITKGVDGYVRESPWRAVGIAAGVGFLLGVMLRHR